MGVRSSQEQPVFDPADVGIHLVEVPAGTPPRFPLAQRLGEQRRELDAPLAKGFVADDDASLLEQFLRISVSEWEAVEPYRVLDDAD